MFDLDGVVYIGGEAVPGVAPAIAALREGGTHVAFVTNNASRRAEAVAEHLVALGVPARPEDVVTSAQAAARVLLATHGHGAPVLVMGADGLVDAVRTAGLVPVTDPEASEVVAVVTGFGPDVVWKDLMRVAVRIRDGLPWVASNTDLTFPASFGLAPGHGTQVEMLRRFSNREPVVAGKPARPLLDETIRRVGGARPLMVGDRLDTDIEGARAVEVASLLVLTGVSGLVEVVAAQPRERPDFIASTLEGLFEAHPAPTVEERPEAGVVSTLDGWRAAVGPDGVLQVEGVGSVDDWWRAVSGAAWGHLDRTGRVADVARLLPPHEDVGTRR
ncbi:HAD-IIA family hydrolase [Nocardioides sp. Y6]|uniref:HAD-IIA family hydrolase n=2 Tax=Nocardioides malaquae TaxID=2773426 RepID=A0ABR9RRP0_9ACTN|nr:HAD-IIA family hydrolase [Nocardioides malaquae]